MSNGRYGDFGGQYIPETLMNEIHKLEEAYERFSKDPEFIAELDKLNREYAGRPSLLYYADKMTKDLGGAKIYFKREDLNHTGSHKINNVLGQCLLAKKMGKTRIIAETGAGQHGVAAATAAAHFNYENVLIYCDPPYMLETRHGKQYRCEMSDSDHEELLDMLLRHKGYVIISGYDTALYNDMLRSWNRFEKISYTQVVAKKKEIIWMNYDPPNRQLSLNDIK